MVYGQGKIIIEGKEYIYSPVLSADDGNVLFLSCLLEKTRASNVYLEKITLDYNNSYYSGDVYPQWIGYDYKQLVPKAGVAIYLDNYFVHNPKSFEIQAMKKDVWETLVDVDNVRWVKGKPNVYWFNKVIVAKQFRIYLKAGYSSYATAIHRVRFIDGAYPYLALYKKDNELWGMQNSIFTKFTDDCTALTDSEKAALFASTNYKTPTATDLKTLGKFKTLMYSEDNSQQSLSITAAKHDQIILPRGLIDIAKFEGIDKAIITSSMPINSAVKIIVTTDLTTYLTYDFETQTWKTIDHTDLAAIELSGIDTDKLTDIPRAAWDTLTANKAGIGFAYLLGIGSTANVCNVDKLQLQVDMKGKWNMLT